MVVLALCNIIDLPRARVHLTNKHLLFNLIMVVLEEYRNHRTIIALETLDGSAQMSWQKTEVTWAAIAQRVDTLRHDLLVLSMKSN